METIIILLLGLLALGILVRQFSRAAVGKGCASCADRGCCPGPKTEQKQQFSQTGE